MAHDVFISFSSKDFEVAKKICHGLETRNIACWMSSRDVLPGADFQESIIDALEKARVMVLVFSTNANNSNEMKKELVLAGDYKLAVLPVRIEKVLPSGAFRFQLSIRQYLDLFEDWDANLAKLAQQITRILSAAHEQPDAISELDNHPVWDDVPLEEPVDKRAPEHPDESAPLEGGQHRPVVHPDDVPTVEERQERPVWEPDEAPAMEDKPDRPAGPPGHGEASTEDLLWSQVKDSENPADLKQYLLQFPLGGNAAAARSRIEVLKQSQDRKTPTSGRWPRGPVLAVLGIAAVVAMFWLLSVYRDNRAGTHMNIAPGATWAGMNFNEKKSSLNQQENITPQDRLYVDYVAPNSPADTAGVLPDDVIVAANGRQMRTGNDMMDLLGDLKPGDELKLELSRRGSVINTSFMLGDLQNAVERGIAAAMSSAGTLYAQGNKRVPADYAAALNWFQKAAALGDPQGMNGMCALYYMGLGVGKDEAKAFEWCKKAAEAGHRNAMSAIADAYAFGTGVATNDAMALDWYRKAAEKQVPYAMLMIGSMYADGAGVSKDDVQALSWYRKAADMEEPRAITQMGLFYFLGRGVEQDIPTALKWCQKGADFNDPKAMSCLGNIYSRRGMAQDFTKALGWYRRGIDLGDKYSATGLGFLYYVGAGVPKNDAEAFSWFKKAADAGDSEGLAQVGIMYESGEGVAQDYAQALSAYRKAADLNSPMAMTRLGYLYLDGHGVNRDTIEALRWFHKAADLGDTPAMGAIGQCYSDGTGVTRNDAEALSWYLKAAKLGDATAARVTAFRYLSGIGVAADSAESLRWMRFSASKGDVLAKGWLREHGFDR